ncbi:hypothetical protein [Oryza sativa Japonica Group]|uniref:Uncharacterized protein n=1 Tax=Oryza sativa subsp. japonica TaxID=39947 RepID=Q5JKS6_ORYSJ|nr:hypothetical protein [Oryza sativa Japonica Group]
MRPAAGDNRRCPVAGLHRIIVHLGRSRFLIVAAAQIWSLLLLRTAWWWYWKFVVCWLMKTVVLCC